MKIREFLFTSGDQFLLKGIFLYEGACKVAF